jgi:hypothetical protein
MRGSKMRDELEFINDCAREIANEGNLPDNSTEISLVVSLMRWRQKEGVSFRFKPNPPFNQHRVVSVQMLMG